MEEKVKLHELDEKQRNKKIAKMKKNAKKITNKVLVIVFSVLLILLMVFSLLQGAFGGNENNSDEHNHDHDHAHAIVETLI